MKIKKIAGLLLVLGMVFGFSLFGTFQLDSLEVQATEETKAAEETEAPENTEPLEDNKNIAQEIMPDDTVIPEGVFADDYNLSGMTKGEAGQLITDYVNSLSSREIVLKFSGNAETTTADELGFSWSNEDVANKAASFGTRGNLIVRYMELKDIKENNYVFDLGITYDQAKIGAFVDDRGVKYNVAKKEATLTRKNGTFVVTNEAVGVTVDIEQTANRLTEALKTDENLERLELDASIVEVQPTRTADQLSKVKNVLGTYSTSYSTGNVGRSKNLSTGAGKINGTVLMPGETFSGYDVMAPFTATNGYATAGAYENGVVIESVGGGACQIATTLYNAVLLAELEVTQRQNHSMVVGYVPRSQDAAIAGTYKDIKFKNNYNSPIYIEGWTNSGTIGFTIYGNETRPSNRTIKYTSVVLSESYPEGNIVTQDPSMPEGTQKVTQNAYPAVSSQLWKYVYVNGTQTEKILINSDKYAGSPTRLTVGTGAAAAVSPDVTGEMPGETSPDAAGSDTSAPVTEPTTTAEIPAVTEAVETTSSAAAES